MADRIRPIALATLFNLSNTEDRGKDRSFTVHEIGQRAAQLFSNFDYNEQRSSLGAYLAGAVRLSDPHFAGDSWNGCYLLTHEGQAF